MKAIVLSYRGSHKTQNLKQVIISVEGSNTKEDAAKLVGKKVVWTTETGNKIEGEITSPHGNSGAVRAKFSDKGLPGQALGTAIQIA